MEVRLDGAERPPGDRRDLGQAQVAEEAQRDDLAIRFGQICDRRPDRHLALATQGEGRRVVRRRPRVPRRGAPREMPGRPRLIPAPELARHPQAGRSEAIGRRRAACRSAMRTAIRAIHAPNGPSPRQVASDR